MTFLNWWIRARDREFRPVPSRQISHNLSSLLQETRFSTAVRELPRCSEEDFNKSAKTRRESSIAGAVLSVIRICACFEYIYIHTFSKFKTFRILDNTCECSRSAKFHCCCYFLGDVTTIGSIGDGHIYISNRFNARCLAYVGRPSFASHVHCNTQDIKLELPALEWNKIPARRELPSKSNFHLGAVNFKIAELAETAWR